MKKIGRPSKYQSAYCEMLVAYFSKPAHRTLVRVDPRTGLEKETYVANPLPTLIRFAKSIGVDVSTLNNWRKRYPEFATAVQMAKGLQKDVLIQNGLLRLWDPRFTMFIALNNTDLVKRPSGR